MQSSEQFKQVIKPRTTDRHNKPWYDKECKTTKAKCRRLQSFRTSRNVNNLNKYSECKNQYKDICKQKRQTYHKEYAAKLEQSVKDSKCFWKEITKHSKKVSDEPNFSQQNWFDHFSTLFKDSDDLHVIEDENQHEPDTLQFDELEDILFNADISDEEIIEATKCLNINKSVGGTCIPQQIVFGIDLLLPFLRKLFNRLFRNGEIPTQWASSVIIPIFKKGDSENTK